MFRKLIFFLVSFQLITLDVAQGNDRIRLRDVEVLTFAEGKRTTGRRSQSVPQLKCVGGSAIKVNYKPKVVQCYNRGFDGSDVQWECKAEMDDGYSFGEIQVTCEGYDYPDDPFVLKGSCGLEYHLEYSGQGSQSGQKRQTNHSKKSEDDDSVGGLIIFLIVAAIVCYVAYTSCASSDSNRTNPRGPGGGGYPGGNDPPPHPPGFRPDYYPDNNSKPSAPPYPDAPPPYSESTQGSAAPPPSYNNYRSRTAPRQQGADSGPGFWTGLGTGGMLGYLLGNRGNAGGGYYGAQRPRSSWWDSGPSTSTGYTSSYRSSSSSSSGGGTHTSSGFGGTKRR